MTLCLLSEGDEASLVLIGYGTKEDFEKYNVIGVAYGMGATTLATKMFGKQV